MKNCTVYNYKMLNFHWKMILSEARLLTLITNVILYKVITLTRKSQKYLNNIQTQNVIKVFHFVRKWSTRLIDFFKM